MKYNKLLLKKNFTFMTLWSHVLPLYAVKNRLFLMISMDVFLRCGFANSHSYSKLLTA